MSARFLIFAPHPDDEVIGCGGVIARGVSDGTALYVVGVTRGDHLLTALANIAEPPPAVIGSMREAETLRACRLLGLDSACIRFLGFEDGCVERDQAEIEPLFVKIIEEFKPTRIYCTSVWDRHPDHQAVCRAVERACRTANCPAPIWQYAKAETLEKSGNTFERTDISRWYEMKRRAMNEFVCHIGVVSPLQTKPVMPGFIDNYLSTEECFLVGRERIEASDSKYKDGNL